MSDLICCSLPIILLVLLPLLIIGARRWWSMRGMKSRFEMDGAVCLEPEQGNVVIRRNRVRAILLLAFLGAAGIGLLALIPFAVRDMMTSDDLWWEWWENIDRFFALPIGLLIVWGAVILLARSAFLPDVTFDQQNRALLIGRGASERRIPFSDLSRVVVEPVQDRVGGLEVAVVRGDGERIKLGILSGSGMAESAQGIALLIERITGAQAPPPDPGLD